MTTRASSTMSGKSAQPAGARQRLPLTDANLQLAVLGVAVLALLLCFLVGPDPEGVGTHCRLGLPRCGYLAVHGIPCPTCGATTSVSLLTRGRPLSALRTNLGGSVVGCVLALSIPFSLMSALLGWQWMVHLRKVSLHAWTGVVCLLLALFLVGWPQRVERYVDAQSHARAPVRDSAGEGGGRMLAGGGDVQRAPRMP